MAAILNSCMGELVNGMVIKLLLLAIFMLEDFFSKVKTHDFTVIYIMCLIIVHKADFICL